MLNKKHLCTAATLAYHLLFLGGSTTLISGYVEEIQKLRTEIVRQADRAETVANNIKGSIDNINKTGDKLTKSVETVTKVVKKAEKACKKLRFEL